VESGGREGRREGGEGVEGGGGERGGRGGVSPKCLLTHESREQTLTHTDTKNIKKMDT